MKRAALLAASIALGLVAVACSSGGGTTTPAAGTTPSGDGGTPAATTAAGTAGGAAFDFPTGPAVTVEDGYAPPEDRVPSTGGYLPANGKPTLVYVDAIW